MRPRNVLMTIGLAIVLMIAAFFVTTFPPTPELWPVSVGAIILFSAPVIYATLRWLGWKRGSLVLLGLGLYALAFETLAVMTGVPYGHFAYTDVLGPKVFGITPYTVLLAWTPLVLGVVALRQGHHGWRALATATGLLVIVDMVLDPAAVALGFWRWSEPGVYYGVPLVNFVGWIISGGIAIGLLEYFRRRNQWPRVPMILTYNLAAIIFFWSAVNVFRTQWLPVVIGIGLLCLIGIYIRGRKVLD